MGKYDHPFFWCLNRETPGQNSASTTLQTTQCSLCSPASCLSDEDRWSWGSCPSCICSQELLPPVGKNDSEWPRKMAAGQLPVTSRKLWGSLVSPAVKRLVFRLWSGAWHVYLSVTTDRGLVTHLFPPYTSHCPLFWPLGATSIVSSLCAFKE